MLDPNIPEEKEALESLHAFNKKHPGRINTWATVLRYPDGTLKVFEAVCRPCYGEMRAYGDLSTRPQDPQPGDLPDPLPPRNEKAPDGPLREGVALPFHIEGALASFLTGPESPWRDLFSKGVEFTRVAKENGGPVQGLVIPDSEVDPTLLVSFCMNAKGSFQNYLSLRAEERFAGVSDIDIFILSKMVCSNGRTAHIDSYRFSPNPSIHLLKKGKYNDLSNSNTFRQGEDYNRPQLQELFSHFGKDKEDAGFYREFLSKKSEFKGPEVHDYILSELAKIPSA